ncbi:M20 metallopeptidase family protein [Sinosporangium siamense]|uniref:Amidohydrolase n=1 Tax=Sinosporangium siamense TaxID=1367973 RepID=A0A919RNH4_9ACTN|nr:M20 family metallopeptidase [Sinosporangium siamense]GII97030.1 amidohydrolase [Sinosporangium siamense]
MSESLLRDADSACDAVIDLRRALHREPELGLDLPKTQARLLAALEPLDLPTTLGRASSSVVVRLDGDQPGPLTLLRADMDALPVTERTGLPYTSEVPGAMHACGHDAHTAMLMGAAHVLHARRAELCGTALLVFQPGEEGYGGCRKMIGEGLLDPLPDRAFALHQSPTLASGHVATRPGPLLAAGDVFQVTVTGRGGHASRPHEADDVLGAAAALVPALHARAARAADPARPWQVYVSTVNAGTAPGVIADRAVLTGGTRTLEESARARAVTLVGEVATGIAEAHGCAAEVTWTSIAPATVNDPDQTTLALDTATALLGADRVHILERPAFASEDFGHVLARVPGTLLQLGTRPPGALDPAPNHSPLMCLDEGALVTGVALYAALALAPAE